MWGGKGRGPIRLLNTGWVYISDQLDEKSGFRGGGQEPERQQLHGQRLSGNLNNNQREKGVNLSLEVFGHQQEALPPK